MNELLFNILQALPTSLFYQLTTPVPYYSMNAYWRNGISSWLFDEEDDPQNRLARIFSLDTCNFDSWLNKGMCSVSFSGLSELFGIDIRINAYIKKCDSHEFPEIYVECSGADCVLFSQTKFCSSNSDCPTFSTCSSYRDTLLSLYDRGNIAIPIDYFSYYVDYDEKCNHDFDSFVIDVKNLLALWSKKQSNPTDKVCSWDWDHLLAVADTWAQSQVAQDGLYYRIIKLSRWNVPNSKK